MGDTTESTLHAVHTHIVNGLAAALDHTESEEAADAAIKARTDLAEGAEIIDQISSDT